MIVLLQDFMDREISIDKKFLNKLKKIDKIDIYKFKFDLNGDLDFQLKDLSFKNVAEDIHDKYKQYPKIFVIGLEQSSPYALAFANIYPNKCKGVICFPLRLYTKESYDRRIWKFKDNKGWEKYISQKYGIDNYLLKLNNKRLQELINKSDNQEEYEILRLTVDMNLRKQYNKIPQIFKIPTYLFTRLDLSAKDIIKHNFDRKEIADMKQITSKDDAFFNSMTWNIARVQYDDILIKKNKNNNNLRIQYLASMDNKQVDYYQDLLDRIVLMIK